MNTALRQIFAAVGLLYLANVGSSRAALNENMATFIPRLVSSELAHMFVLPAIRLAQHFFRSTTAAASASRLQRVLAGTGSVMSALAAVRFAKNFADGFTARHKMRAAAAASALPGQEIRRGQAETDKAHKSREHTDIQTEPGRAQGAMSPRRSLSALLGWPPLAVVGRGVNVRRGVVYGRVFRHALPPHKALATAAPGAHGADDKRMPRRVRELKLDIYLHARYCKGRSTPSNMHSADGVRVVQRPRGVLVYIHGGGWTVGHRAFASTPLLFEAAARGFAVVAPSYRLAPKAAWPAQLLDCKRALAWVHARLREDSALLGGAVPLGEHMVSADLDLGMSHVPDPAAPDGEALQPTSPPPPPSRRPARSTTPVFVAGESAGGHLALMLALTQNFATLGDSQNVSRFDKDVRNSGSDDGNEELSSPRDGNDDGSDKSDRTSIISTRGKGQASLQDVLARYAQAAARRQLRKRRQALRGTLVTEEHERDVLLQASGWDTSVDACFDLYGVHDFQDIEGHFRAREDSAELRHGGSSGMRLYLEHLVVQRRASTPGGGLAFADASPLEQLRRRMHHAAPPLQPLPPIVGIHPQLDTLVPIEDARCFYRELKRYRESTSPSPEPCPPDMLIEVPGAHHAFTYLPSMRSFCAVDIIMNSMDRVQSLRECKPRL